MPAEWNNPRSLVPASPRAPYFPISGGASHSPNLPLQTALERYLQQRVSPNGAPQQDWRQVFTDKLRGLPQATWDMIKYPKQIMDRARAGEYVTTDEMIAPARNMALATLGGGTVMPRAAEVGATAAALSPAARQ